MDKIYNSPIFSGLTRLEIDLLLEGRHRITNYKMGELIAAQGSPYHSLLIVDGGVVRGEMTSFAGNSVVIEEISAPRVIAPAVIFASDNRLPVTVMAMTNTDIVSIKSGDFTDIMQLEYRVLHNFMRSISDRNKFLSDRVRTMSFGTIRSKLANYLLMQIRLNGGIEFTISHTHQELADMFGVTRPALSRAVRELSSVGVLVSRRGYFRIIDEGFLREAAAK